MTAPAAPSTRGVRALRGLAAAAVATAAAATSHSLSGGALSLVGLAIAGVFAAIVCIALAGRSLSLPRLGASVLVSQLAFHLAFSYIGTGDAIMRMGHHETTIIAPNVTATPPADTTMWFGHAIAAFTTIVLLRHGESAFWRLRELVLFALAVWAIPLADLPRAAARPTWLAAGPRLFLVRCTALRYRGPPAIRFA